MICTHDNLVAMELFCVQFYVSTLNWNNYTMHRQVLSSILQYYVFPCLNLGFLGYFLSFWTWDTCNEEEDGRGRKGKGKKRGEKEGGRKREGGEREKTKKEDERKKNRREEEEH